MSASALRACSIATPSVTVTNALVRSSTSPMRARTARVNSTDDTSRRSSSSLASWAVILVSSDGSMLAVERGFPPTFARLEPWQYLHAVRVRPSGERCAGVRPDAHQSQRGVGVGSNAVGGCPNIT